MSRLYNNNTLNLCLKNYLNIASLSIYQLRFISRCTFFISYFPLHIIHYHYNNQDRKSLCISSILLDINFPDVMELFHCKFSRKLITPLEESNVRKENTLNCFFSYIQGVSNCTVWFLDNYLHEDNRMNTGKLRAESPVMLRQAWDNVLKRAFKENSNRTSNIYFKT